MWHFEACDPFIVTLRTPPTFWSIIRPRSKFDKSAPIAIKYSLMPIFFLISGLLDTDAYEIAYEN